jgi:hypothetical protein
MLPTIPVSMPPKKLVMSVPMPLNMPLKKFVIGLDDLVDVAVAAGVVEVFVVLVALVTLGVAFAVVLTELPVGSAAAAAIAASGVARGFVVVVVVVTLLRTASPPREARAYSYLYCPRHPIVDRNQL